MKAVVTGGAGFIGSNVVGRLLADRWAVVVIDDFSSGYETNVPRDSAVRQLEGDVRDSALVADAMQGADVVFHLAASVGNKRSIDDPFTDADINLVGTLVVLEAMRKARVPTIVFSSSAGVYGELKELPIRESHPTEPQTPYGVSKLAAEKMCLAYASLYGIRAVALRYFNVYGIRQRYDAYGNVIPIFVHRLLNYEPLIVFSDGEQTRDFVNVCDVAEANLLAARASASGAFNIASGISITINLLIELLAAASGIQPVVEYAPPRPGDVRDSLACVDPARSALGYEPSVPLETGLSVYLAWMTKEHELRVGENV
jgi:UDP-glucose 4-epimerase